MKARTIVWMAALGAVLAWPSAGYAQEVSLSGAVTDSTDAVCSITRTNGSFGTAEVSPLFGRPVQNVNVEYQPRIMQLGFRLVF